MKGEAALIDAISRRFSLSAPQLRLGIGDDAAILSPSRRGDVLSVDASVEGVHFRRELLSMADVGFRAFMAAASDLAAMGASPRGALLSLTIPEADVGEPILALVDGVAEAARELALPVVGGNLSGGSLLTITTTVVGEAPDVPITRGGASLGDSIYVSGPVGGAALGLLLLLDDPRRGDGVEAERAFVRAWRRPRAHIALGRELVGRASAAIDLSDGLARDLTHLCEASGVGAELVAEAIPRAPGFDALAESLGREPLALALAGGEDYALLFTAPDTADVSGLGVRVGQIRGDEGVRVRDARGATRPVGDAGFDHFA